MPSIRRRYNFGFVELDPELVLNGSPWPLCHQTVPVRKADGDPENVFFAGFIDLSEVTKKHKRCIITDVWGYKVETRGRGQFTYYNPGALMLGALIVEPRQVYLVLDQDWPIAWCDIIKPKD